MNFQELKQNEIVNGFEIAVLKGQKMAVKTVVIKEWRSALKTPNLSAKDWLFAELEVTVITDYGVTIELTAKSSVGLNYSDGMTKSPNLWAFYRKYKK